MGQTLELSPDWWHIVFEVPLWTLKDSALEVMNYGVCNLGVNERSPYPWFFLGFGRTLANTAFEVMSFGDYGLGVFDGSPIFGVLSKSCLKLWALADTVLEVMNFRGYGLGVFDGSPSCSLRFVSRRLKRWKLVVSPLFSVEHMIHQDSTEKDRW